MAKKSKYTFYVINRNVLYVNNDGEIVNPSYDERMINAMNHINGDPQLYFLVEVYSKVATITGNTLAEIEDQSIMCARTYNLSDFECYRVKK